MNNEKAESKEHLLSSMVILPVKHTFSQDEILEKANEVAGCVATKAKLEAEKKTQAAEYKNKIDKEQAQITLLSGHINNGYATVDKACELLANFETKTRQYKLKETGEIVKEEPLHASDYNILQQKLNLDAVAEENGEAHDYANADPIGAIIEAKKAEKPTPKNNLPDNYNQHEEFDLGIEDDDDEDNDDLFADE